MGTPESDGGWSRVVRKEKRSLRHVRSPPQEGKQEATEVQPNPNPTLTLQDIRKYHEGIRTEWRASECCKKLEALVADHHATQQSITRAICLGPGSFDPANGSWAARRAAHVQVEAFQTLVRALGTSCSRQIVQEPALTPADKEFFSELGLEVVEDSKAFGLVDETTLVYGIHLYIRTWSEALRTQPAMFVGTGLESWQEMTSFRPELEALLKPIEQMHASYELYPFPDMAHIFSATCIYWKKKQPEAEGTSTEASPGDPTATGTTGS